jgi:dephospho-CoA kinase
MPLILAICGDKLGGKDTVTKYLSEKYGAEQIRYSDILNELLSILGLPNSRENNIRIATALRQEFGAGILNYALGERIKKSGAEFIILNGYRFPEELTALKEIGAITLYVTAPENLRYQRFMQRKEKADDAQQTLAQFQEQEQAPTEVHIKQLGAQADYKIGNTGSLEDLHQQIDQLMSKLNHER